MVRYRRSITQAIAIMIGSLATSVASLPVIADEPPVDDRKQSAITPVEGVVRLFDGHSTDGLDTWLKDLKSEDPNDVFRVTDGMLHITGNGLGAIYTRERYRDYHLILEYKWGSRTWHDRRNSARDSGLLVHSNGKCGGYYGIWMPSLEVNIIEGGVGDLVFVPGDDIAGRPVPLSLSVDVSRDRDQEVVWDELGKRESFDLQNLSRINWRDRDPDWNDKIGFRGQNDNDSLFGQWTRIDVLTDDGHIEVHVNGVKVNEAFDASPSEGQIQLQSEFAEIFFRRWELWPINDGPDIGPVQQE